MEEASWRRHQGGGIMKGASWRRHRGGGIKEASGRHLEASWASGRDLDASGDIWGIWQSSGNHLGVIWEASGRHPLIESTSLICVLIWDDCGVPFLIWGLTFNVIGVFRTQWERNLTKHHRNTIAPSSCYTPFNKIIATVTKQLASQIIEPIFLIYVDLR